MDNTVLKHYGVLGMKWGTRRYQSDQAHRATSEAKTAKKLAAKYVNAMDNRADKKPQSLSRTREAKTARKLADKYVNAMDKKAERRTAQVKPEKRTVKDMSDTELRNVINRMQMEKQYSQLTKKQVSVGQKFVSDVLANAAKQTATNYISKYMSKGLESGIDSLIKKNAR